jgi:hypothetical protein
MDIVEWDRRVLELSSLCHGLVDTDGELRAESLPNLACFDGGADEGVCAGTVRFGLWELGAGCGEFGL